MTRPCTKHSYKDQQQATEVLHNIVAKKGDKKKPCRAYECENCGKWHLTSKPIEYQPRNTNQKLVYFDEWKALTK